MNMEHLRELVADYTDEKLLEVYRMRHSDYTGEAVKIIEDEVARRGAGFTARIEAQERSALAGKTADAAVKSLKREDFVPLPHPFSKADALTANAILRDSNAPYIMEQKEGTELFDAFIYNDALTTARELIEEHFEADAERGIYTRKNADITDRLMSFNLSDITFASPAAAAEIIDTDFASAEKTEIIKLAKALLDEADAIEETQGRMVFYYDTMEPLIEKLQGKGGFTRMEFLAIIELCQIFCGDSRYNPILNQTATSILDFFLD